MEWQIPEPLSIRPCQKPSDFKARQLNLYPVKLRKLPQWVDQAGFQPTITKKQEQNQSVIHNQQILTQNDQHFTLHTKYKNKKKYVLQYERGEQKYQFNQNFAHQYIPTNYSVLEGHLQKHRKSEQEKDLEKQENEAPNEQNQKKSYHIQFDSKFQCGNLSKVYQVKNSNEYHLVMQNDINTLGYNQWYAFSVHNYEDESAKIQMKIINFVKQRSLYKKGMKPWIINQNTKVWRQLEGNCFYKKTNVRSQSGDYFYQLEFFVNLLPGSTYIAMLPIYSYSRLGHNIERWKNIKGMSIQHRKVYSLVNNVVPLLEYIPEITKFLTQQQKKKSILNFQDIQNSSDDEYKKSIKTIVVFARIHPGEVWSSFLMEQVIQSIINYYLKSQVNQTNRLRYLFLPMLNPDGVIYGNFRCDFSGKDLNRVWIEPSKFTQSSIYQIKKILNKQLSSKKAAYFIDLHSHSKAYNIFAYTSAENIQQSRLLSDIIRLSQENIIFDPFQQSYKLGNEFIKQSQTTFLSSKDIFLSKKKSTARAFMSRLTEKGRSMTIQISFLGYFSKRDVQIPIKPFQLEDFKILSDCLIKNLNDFLFSSSQQFLQKKKSLMVLYTNFLAQLNRQHNQNLNALKKQNKVLSQQKQVSEDSDSQPEKYYTTETKKLIKSKNGELHDCRIVTHREDKKSYMKQTESMIHKTDVTKKEKNSNKIFERTKIHSLKNNSQNQSKKDDLSKKISISEQPMIAESQRKKKPSISQQLQQNPDVQVNFTSIDKNNMFRKKIFHQSRNKDKKQNAQNKSQFVESRKDLINNSVFEPMILDLDESKKHQPVFGQFLTKSKRSASRRYKTVTKQEFTVFQAEMARLRKNDIKQNIMNKDKQPNALCTFLEDNMYMADLSFPRTQHHKKNISINQQLATGIRQSRNSSRKGIQIYQNKLKRNGLQRANNFKNIYMFQRKKIVEMMNKQTRFYNIIQKQPNPFGQVQEIVDKRKRAKTQFNNFKTYYEEKQKNIFYNMKMNKIQKP